MPRLISGAINAVCWTGGRPPARQTASLLGTSHLGQLFTSTAPSLDPFLVKIKNLGSKDTKSHTARSLPATFNGYDRTRPNVPPSFSPHSSNLNVNLQPVINKSAKGFNKTQEAKDTKESSNKDKGLKRKKRKKMDMRRRVSPRTGVSQWSCNGVKRFHLTLTGKLANAN